MPSQNGVQTPRQNANAHANAHILEICRVSFVIDGHRLIDAPSFARALVPGRLPARVPGMDSKIWTDGAQYTATSGPSRLYIHIPFDPLLMTPRAQLLSSSFLNTLFIFNVPFIISVSIKNLCILVKLKKKQLF